MLLHVSLFPIQVWVGFMLDVDHLCIGLVQCCCKQSALMRGFGSWNLHFVADCQLRPHSRPRVLFSAHNARVLAGGYRGLHNLVYLAVVSLAHLGRSACAVCDSTAT